MSSDTNEIKDKEEEYLDKIRYLGINKLKTLDKKQIKIWKKTIFWQALADYVKDKVRLYIENNMKMVDVSIIILAGIGLITNALQTLFYLDYKVVRGELGYGIEITSKTSTMIEVLRLITSITTLITILLIIFHYEIKRNFLIFKNSIPFNSSFFSKNLFIPMIIEIIIMSIHTPPLMNGVTVSLRTTGAHAETVPIYLDLFISVFILARVYLLCKFYANYSKWGDVFASRVCNECNAKSGLIFTCKAGIKEHPFLSVIIVMVLSILILGFGFRNCEISFVKNMPLKYFQNWTLMENGFWFMTNTLLSIGFGDFYPTTILGRIISFFACIWGILLESLIVVAITNSMSLTSKEESTYNEIHQCLNDRKYKQKALELILNFYRVQFYGNATQVESDFQGEIYSKYDKTLTKAKKTLDEFRRLRLQRERSNRQITVQNLMAKINLNINDSMDYLLKSTKNQINLLLDNMNQAQENQNKILLFSGILDVLYKNLYEKIRERSLSNELQRTPTNKLKEVNMNK